MSDRGICFDSEMVRALLAGTKTMTRRVMRPQPTVVAGIRQWHGFGCAEGDRPGIFGPWVPGDHLYCRETIRRHDGQPPTATYVVDLSPVIGTHPPESYCGRAVWQWPRSKVLAGRYMPRWAARLFLEVTDVRIERLQSITEADARAEGVVPDRLYSDAMRAMHHYSEYVCAFHDLWDRLNGKRRGYPWASDPWCWCISFRRVEGA